ncbi:unnamed protein product, partial [Ascophyllum nodosum]
EKEASAGGGADGVDLSMLAELGKGKGKKSKAAMQKLLASMLGDGNGAGSDVGNLSLRELLKQKGEPQLVLAGDTVRTAGKAIARGRKAVLVVDDGTLVG